MVIHAQADDESTEGHKVGVRRGYGWVQVPQDGRVGRTNKREGKTWSASPELAQESLHGERGTMLDATPCQGHLPLARKLVDRVHEIAATQWLYGKKVSFRDKTKLGTAHTRDMVVHACLQTSLAVADHCESS